MATTAYIWTYRVKPEWRDRFREAYGPHGEWTKFFARSADYIRTDLLCDEDDDATFATIDYFGNGDARAALVEAFAAEYEAIDARWRDATTEESFVGAFAVLSKV